MLRPASWYRQLASLTRVGITIPAAVAQASGPSRRRREALAERLEMGEDPRRVWPDCGLHLDESDAVVLAAGQLSGRFPDVCDELATRHETRSRLRSRMFMSALYPILLVHIALILSPFVRTDAFTGGTSPGVDKILSDGALGAALNLATLWTLVGAGWLLFSRFPRLRTNVLRLLPLWGAAARHGSLATLAGTLASLLRAGVTIGPAWSFAGKASGDSRLIAAADSVARAVEERRMPPWQVLPEIDAIPGDFRALYTAGERSGSLEARLDEIRARHEETAVLRATAASILYPVIFGVLVMLLFAAKILSFYSGYFSNLGNLPQ